jgi:hypothetical protein
MNTVAGWQVGRRADWCYNSDKPAVMEGFPMKEWTVEIYVLDQDGKEKPARCFTKAVYHLHPSFENPDQSMFNWANRNMPRWDMR